ncbi:hypothetical protein DF186_21345 [Enterococcus hirae]|nr:hypothetical protein DF186_21345 [Enterococcus hirae]
MRRAAKYRDGRWPCRENDPRRAGLAVPGSEGFTLWAAFAAPTHREPDTPESRHVPSSPISNKEIPWH